MRGATPHSLTFEDTAINLTSNFETQHVIVPAREILVKIGNVLVVLVQVRNINDGVIQLRQEIHLHDQVCVETKFERKDVLDDINDLTCGAEDHILQRTRDGQKVRKIDSSLFWLHGLHKLEDLGAHDGERW
eukprot:TRINITY_DN6635_c0_g1_i1.p2 TRINITY_DN6635_c0_g1~~TRINITY_DN6635_c0_g1_i1.p2  ORF type:complete len:132 (+),score=12.37 TRINITY_DN6635_c0_g1_i1:72-467(+)